MFRNSSETELDLSGWTVIDEVGKAYTFPTAMLLFRVQR
jgi:hypothetical protein